MNRGVRIFPIRTLDGNAGDALRRFSPWTTTGAQWAVSIVRNWTPGCETEHACFNVVAGLRFNVFATEQLSGPGAGANLWLQNCCFRNRNVYGEACYGVFRAGSRCGFCPFQP